MMKKVSPVTKSISIGLSLLVLDLVLKNLVSGELNPGFWLGIRVPYAVGLSLQIIIILVVMISAYKFQSYRNLLLVLGIVSVSNLVDRIVVDGVRDYLQILGIWFNIADAVISLIVIILVIKILQEENDNIESRGK